MGRFEILEHTADVGVRGIGDTLEEAFEQTTLGLLDITGTYRPGVGRPERIEVGGDDLGALLVNWLEEVLYLQDARDAVIGEVVVESVDGGRVVGRVALEARGEEIAEGTAVKAITYHQLIVERTPEGYVAQAFVDV